MYTCSPYLRRPLVTKVPFWGVCWANQHYGSPYLFAAHLTSSEVLSDFQIWCSRGLSDALGLNDIENLFTVLISISPHHVFEITGLPVVVMNSQHLFADSLTSVDIAWLVKLWTGLPRACQILTLTFDWCWIWYRTFNILRWWCRRCRSRDKLDNEVRRR